MTIKTVKTIFFPAYLKSVSISN